MKFDIIIVGASIAGTSAATLLAREGYNIALIDKASFPRRKPCGEGLSKLGVSYLKKHKLIDLNNLEHLTFDGYRLTSGNKSKIVNPANGGGVSIQREKLDLSLVEGALQHKNITPFFGLHADQIDPEGSIKVGKDRVHCRIIILADGANSKLAETVAPKKLSAPQRMGISATFRGDFKTNPCLVHIFVEKEYELYCTPLANGRLNINLLSTFPSSINLRETLLNQETLRKAFEPLGFNGELELPPLGRAPIGNAMRNAFHKSTILIGDCIEELDPIGGMGMTHALISSELAVSAITQLQNNADAFEWYKNERYKKTKPLRTFTKLCYHLLRNSNKMPSLIDVMSSPAAQYATSLLFSLGELGW